MFRIEVTDADRKAWEQLAKDSGTIRLSPEAMREFEAILDRPARELPQLKALLTELAPHAD